MYKEIKNNAKYIYNKERSEFRQQPLNNIRPINSKRRQQTGKAFSPRIKWEEDTDSALDIPDFLRKDPIAQNENHKGGRRIKYTPVVVVVVSLLAISGFAIFTDYLTVDVRRMLREKSSPQAKPMAAQDEAAAETVTPPIIDKVGVSQAKAMSPDPVPSISAKSSPKRLVDEPAINSPSVSGKVPMPSMITIEQGQYLVPTTKINRNDYQLEKVKLGRFRIATSEVTREQWRICASDASCSMEGFPEQYFVQSKLSLPITSITTDQIMGFIDWINTKRGAGVPAFRLPSDAEWIVAARGGETGHRNFAWGRDFDPAMIRATDGLIPVEHGEPVNGLYGMSDNAAERVNGCWIKELSNGECFRSLGIVRGPLPGSVDEKTTSLSHYISRSKNASYQNIGFRLAQ